jgi:hypothetical protein
VAALDVVLQAPLCCVGLAAVLTTLLLRHAGEDAGKRAKDLSR